ncbi:MAG TPA: hypothetical protein PKD85_14035, partial [Saprospiraceae bacterium]|nr:hypothetical protein [Saprospiraceae bacterium]
MGFVSSIVGQNRIQFILPQNIYTKGEKIVLIIVPQNQNLSELPVTINIRSCESEKVLSQIFIYADSKNYIYEIDQPKDLTEGSYIISASLLAREESKIIEDHANIFHLLDLGLSEKYFTFETNQYQYQNESKAPSVNIKLRQEFQLDPRNSGVLFSVDQRYLYKPSYINYYIEGQLDELHRLYFEGNDLNNVYAFFPRSRKAIKLMQATQMNMSNLPITRESVDGFYLFDTFKSKIKDINPRNPSNVPPAKYNLKLMRKDDIDFINSLADNAAITEKISYLVEDPKEMDREDEYEIIADNNYNLTDFPEFESVPLFLKEVIYPSKIVKSKSGEKEREIVLLSSINKKWYTSKCLLIIDGLTQNNHEVLLQMSWRDISQIKLYRKVETL